MERFDFTRGTAVVTGAAGGIGEQLAHALARRGSALALVDRDAEGLERVAKAVGQVSGRPVATYVVDLSDDAATHALGATLVAAHPDATLLVNNAGVALGGTFEQVSEEEFDWLMAVNYRAVVTLTRALLPVLRANAGSHLVNLSSLFGLIAPPGQVAYATSKFAVRGFTEALRAELAGRVGVTVVHPGGIRTRIAESSRFAAGVPAAEQAAGRSAFNRLLTYPPERAAEEIATAVERRRPRLLIALSARVPDLVARLFPGRYSGLMALVLKAAGRPK
ncbi:SDR family NAD(P)-dependent oxidoreductase [Streptacidiphilus anmyonensis]|uniref:SDR family NAD(P)-dependent oxidoreductase n=1 Tax=Streptacidiphilus anmyonensis TaxID=405782 RepID=UPI0005AB37B2|nr:SDR family oxidoreductase [Streptacidiphilus anmyonensis]